MSFKNCPLKKAIEAETLCMVLMDPELPTKGAKRPVKDAKDYLLPKNYQFSPPFSDGVRPTEAILLILSTISKFENSNDGTANTHTKLRWMHWILF